MSRKANNPPVTYPSSSLSPSSTSATMTGPEEKAGEDLADHDSLYSTTTSPSQNILTPTTTPAASQTGGMNRDNSTGERTSGSMESTLVTAETQSRGDSAGPPAAGRYERLRDQEARLVTSAARLAKMRSSFTRDKLQQLAELDEQMAELQARKAEISALVDDENEQGTPTAPTFFPASNVHEVDPQANDHLQSLSVNTEQRDQMAAALQEISSLQAHVQALEIQTKERAGTVTTLTTAVSKLQSDFLQLQQALTESREQLSIRIGKVEARSTEQDAKNSHLETRIMPLERACLGSSLAGYVRLQGDMSVVRDQAESSYGGPLPDSFIAKSVWNLCILLADRALYSSECIAFRSELSSWRCRSADSGEGSRRNNKPAHAALVAMIDKYEPHVSEMVRAALAAWEAADEHQVDSQE
ncbi:hypothetical protein LTR27_012846 [Elasticomyces elasticus]|nr:hypothetical protein LTR27_012846 [Elasticomyces elasticus]